MHRWISRALTALVLLAPGIGSVDAQISAADTTTLEELVISALQTHERVEIASSEIRPKRPRA